MKVGCGEVVGAEVVSEWTGRNPMCRPGGKSNSDDNWIDRCESHVNQFR